MRRERYVECLVTRHSLPVPRDLVGSMDPRTKMPDVENRQILHRQSAVEDQRSTSLRSRVCWCPCRRAHVLPAAIEHLPAKRWPWLPRGYCCAGIGTRRRPSVDCYTSNFRRCHEKGIDIGKKVFWLPCAYLYRSYQQVPRHGRVCTGDHG